MDVDALFREHEVRLRRYLSRVSGSPDVADDVLQETFMRVLERPPRTHDNVKAWLFTVATNVLRDRTRRASRHDQLLQASPQVPRSPVTPLEHSERQELRGRLYAALATLGRRERVAIVMREEGFTHREIADALSTTTGTIGTLLARAFTKLAARLPLDRDVT